MLARLLRISLVTLMGMGAALGYWFGGIGPDGARPVFVAVSAALAMPLGITFIILIYSAARSRPGESNALWWRALVGENFAALRIFYLRQTWAFAAPGIADHTAQVAGVPVILVHGFICNARLWDEITPVLREQGHTVLAINLEPVFTSIDNYAPLIEQAVQALRAHTGQNRVALVGHSMGGLAIRAWIRRYGTTHVARAITLGTPHAGTRLGRRPTVPNGTQMMWQSRWLAELAESETVSTRALFRIALTPQDEIVFPQRAQTLAGVEPAVFEGLGHLELCTSEVVTRWLCAELEAA